MYYDAPVKLQRLNLDDPSTDTDATDETEDDAGDASAQVQIYDSVRSTNAAEHHYFLEDRDVMSAISSCVKGVDMTLDVSPITREKVAATARHLSKRLERKLQTLPKKVRHNFVWAACRDNIHPFCQLIASAGQLPKNIIAHSISDSILKPHKEAYHHPMDDHPDDATLYGVGIYVDDDSLRPV